MTQDKSPAYQFMEMIWHHAYRAANFSYRRLNHALYDGLELAITAGFEFDEGDFGHISREMNGGYWFYGDAGKKGEGFYTTACKERNLSACQSFEAYKERKPFIIDGDRLHIGSEFHWYEHWVEVTSFNDEEGYVTACKFRTVEDKEYGYPVRKVDRRFSITHEDIYERNARLRQAEKLKADLRLMSDELVRKRQALWHCKACDWAVWTECDCEECDCLARHVDSQQIRQQVNDLYGAIHEATHIG